MQMVTHKVIKIEEREYYIYGIELFICNMLTILGVAVIAIITKTILSSFVYSLVFCLLRAYAGGYHCKTYLRCFCTSLGIYICMTVTNMSIVEHKNILSVLLLAASIPVIFITAPVVHENHPLDDDEKVRNRKKSLILLSIFFGASLLGFALRLTDLVYAVACAITAVAVLIILTKTGGTNDEKGNSESSG